LLILYIFWGLHFCCCCFISQASLFL
jgi:hypothetical protein